MMFTFIYGIDMIYIVVLGADFKMDANMWRRCKKGATKINLLALTQRISRSVWIIVPPKYPDPTTGVINLMVTGKRTGNQNQIHSN